MRKFIKFMFLGLVFVFMLTSCNSDTDKNIYKSSSPTVESAVEETKTSDELKTEIIGQWGRLDEVMHYFTEDKRCVIGGMQGTYEIDNDCNLVLTTMSGSVTTYDWASSVTQTTSDNYWYLDGDILTVNGNNFTRIYGKDTPDYVE